MVGLINLAFTFDVKMKSKQTKKENKNKLSTNIYFKPLFTKRHKPIEYSVYKQLKTIHSTINVNLASPFYWIESNKQGKRENIKGVHCKATG